MEFPPTPLQMQFPSLFGFDFLLEKTFDRFRYIYTYMYLKK